MPAVSNIVFQNNKALPAGDVWINLQGIAIGNGLTNPLVQYEYYAEQVRLCRFAHRCAAFRVHVCASSSSAPHPLCRPTTSV